VKRVTIYGAGDVGRVLVSLLREHGIVVQRLADRDPALWGTSIDGITVTSIADCASDRTPVVVLASLSHATAMRRAVQQALHGTRGLRIIAPRRWDLA
jgi:FlaA1/EpsC-like NDP-sugar epimerase